MERELYGLFVLALPIACIARTVTQEDVFKELREYCIHHSKHRTRLLARKFFYLFTCEYCFSHWVTIGMLWISDYQLYFIDWRGVLIAGFALVWVANLYLGSFAWLKLLIRYTRALAEHEEHLAHPPTWLRQED